MAKHFSLSFRADEMALREALAQAMHFLKASGFHKDIRATVEIVLAEAINNVIEHAYEGANDGQVDLRIDAQDGALSFIIEDDGTPMPGGIAPRGRVHDLECDLQDLPEGGFGWFLIRELTENLKLHRQGSRNRLSFTMQPAALPQ